MCGKSQNVLNLFKCKEKSTKQKLLVRLKRKTISKCLERFPFNSIKNFAFPRLVVKATIYTRNSTCSKRVSDGNDDDDDAWIRQTGKMRAGKEREKESVGENENWKFFKIVEAKLFKWELWSRILITFRFYGISCEFLKLRKRV